MKLTQLLASTPHLKISGDTAVEIKGITDDSRKVKNGYIFVAIPGLHFDAHEFIKDAVKFGAAAVIGEKDFVEEWNGAAYVKVSNSRETLAALASAWYGNPSSKLTVIGVTGTKGKTTTASIIYEILKNSGKKTGLITSNGAVVGSKKIDTGFHVTNPEPLELQACLRKMVDAGTKYAVLEVTSHGLDQRRVGSINFDCAVLTNLSHEHLDYHKTMDNYREAKSKLFHPVRISVLNMDDPQYKFFEKASKGAQIVTYSLQDKKADYFIPKYSEDGGIQRFIIINQDREYKFATPFLGDFNLANILAAIAVAREYGCAWNDIAEALLKFRGIEGRLESVKNDKGVDIVIDFAHTPDSLEKLLVYLKLKTKGRLICVFGCASERDTLKRPIMGKISATYADVSVLTAEDPRKEDIQKILAEISTGIEKNLALELDTDQLPKDKTHAFYIIPERGEAITFAINKIAKSGDTVAICGKGHEKSMNYNGKEYAWSDREAVYLALKGKIFQIEKQNGKEKIKRID